jgi:Uncharacterized conserved protein
MPGVTRIRDDVFGICDLGVFGCCSHDNLGENDTGSGDVEANGLPVHRLRDTGPCKCAHGGRFESVEGEASVEVNRRPVVLVGHQIVCTNCTKPGNHTTGSGNVVVGG